MSCVLHAVAQDTDSVACFQTLTPERAMKTDQKNTKPSGHAADIIDVKLQSFSQSNSFFRLDTPHHYMSALNI